MAAIRYLLLSAFVLVCPKLYAVVLADDKIDVLYHSYDGGGASIDGPSLLVRKSIGNQVSLHGNYYVDTISSASIDVVATASSYSEERTEYSAGVDFLNNKSIFSLNYTNSSENDYEAEAMSLGVTHDFFGDLTTLGFGLSLGDNTVRRNGDSTFEETNEQRRFKLSLSQIVTKNLITNLALETVVDDGFLNNPYRQVRFADNSTRGYSYEPELYPSTRNSDAIALRLMYYLPYRASLKAEYRDYSDSWDIAASNVELKYTHPLKNWLFELKFRSYTQTAASFYQDLFAFSEATSFRARDKELSQYSSTNYGLGVTYTLKGAFMSGIDKATVNLYWDYFQFDYDNFRDVTIVDTAAGEEPLYSLDANVIRLFFSFWY